MEEASKYSVNDSTSIVEKEKHDDRFSGFYDSYGDEPPIILNKNASIHSKVCWCCEQAGEMLTLALELQDEESSKRAKAHLSDEDKLPSRFGDIFYRNALQLKAMLEHLEEATNQAPAAKAAA
ncbi:hypothetical protein [Candidatus Symbiobacter mobilis]|uniref:Uncharacterized protein n=1 Tax=Candidatus Symbiobacter mobilis CR TaxID=946483 RepID=U5N9H0_9BURK|nr:hypothetical protein [Candidatus Symbiobacter mobilis]AGX88052.1 hypothetical protein Cenrod_1978 [Candidatus Symbiobacter mobilis CR]